MNFGCIFREAVLGFWHRAQNYTVNSQGIKHEMVFPLHCFRTSTHCIMATNMTQHCSFWCGNSWADWKNYYRCLASIRCVIFGSICFCSFPFLYLFSRRYQPARVWENVASSFSHGHLVRSIRSFSDQITPPLIMNRLICTEQVLKWYKVVQNVSLFWPEMDIISLFVRLAGFFLTAKSHKPKKSHSD